MMAAWNVRGWVVETGLWAMSIAAIATLGAVLAKTPVGRFVKFVYLKIWKEPLTETVTRRIASVVSDNVRVPLLELARNAQRLEEKNDMQHADNKQVIVDMSVVVAEVKVLGETIVAQHEGIMSVLDAHLKEAEVDRRRLELVEFLITNKDRRVSDTGDMVAR